MDVPKNTYVVVVKSVSVPLVVVLVVWETVAVTVL